MIKKRAWIFTGIYFILGVLAGYFTSIRMKLPESIYIILDDAIPVIVLILFCVIFSKTYKRSWKNSIGLGAGLAFGHDVYNCRSCSDCVDFTDDQVCIHKIYNKKTIR